MPGGLETCPYGAELCNLSSRLPSESRRSEGVIETDDGRQPAAKARPGERIEDAGRDEEVPGRIELDACRRQDEVQITRSRLELAELGSLHRGHTLKLERFRLQIEAPAAAQRAADDIANDRQPRMRDEFDAGCVVQLVRQGHPPAGSREAGDEA